MKIDYKYIEELMEDVDYQIKRIEGTNATIAIAIRGTTVIGIGFSSCLDEVDFNAATGVEEAVKNARSNAIDFLWQSEGYKCKYPDQPRRLPNAEV